MAKEGSTVSGLMDSFATAISLALQHGVPLRVLAEKFAHTRFEPSGWTGNEQIGYAKSIMDYLFRWMQIRFLNGHQLDLFHTLHPQPEPPVASPSPASVGGARGTVQHGPRHRQHGPHRPQPRRRHPPAAGEHHAAPRCYNTGQPQPPAALSLRTQRPPRPASSRAHRPRRPVSSTTPPPPNSTRTAPPPSPA